jgi:hypothetical protein
MISALRSQIATRNMASSYRLAILWRSRLVFEGAMYLFSVTGDTVDSVSAVAFATHHLEQQLHSWADRHPALIDAGRPMISLGCEIPTHHGHYVDNLLIDATGTLVAVEIKRGQSPSDVVAQMLDYAAFVSGLGWSDVDGFCRIRHGSDASEVFARTLPSRQLQTT